jgi:hypothetical protein
VSSLLGIAAVAAALAGAPQAAPRPSTVEPASRRSIESGAPRLWLRAGIASTVAGSALVIAAIVVGASDPCSAAGTGTCRQRVRDRTAIALGIPGALALAGGIAMTVMGARQRRISGGATASRHGAGLWLQARL